MNILDNMDLPKVNPMEELEQLSKDKLRPLLQIELFEIREETYRDKGIDLDVELKHKNQYTNFRFSIQLKASAKTQKNKDGSFSIQIETSNIQYLLNGGKPAYYIIYLKHEDKFYYQSISGFLKNLNEKDENWDSQPTHTLRVDEELSSETIKRLYNDVSSKAQFKRKLNEKIALKSAMIPKENNLVIDDNLNIYDDAEIRRMIESVGFHLINEGESNRVVAVHNKASKEVGTSPKYNLIVGIAHYNTGKLFESFTILRDANHQKDELKPSLINHLNYFFNVVKYALGLIRKNEYEKIITGLEETDNIGYYLKIENARKDFFNSKLVDFEKYKISLSEIIKSDDSPVNIKLFARAELSLYQGHKNNKNYVTNICKINAAESLIGISMGDRLLSANQLMVDSNQWTEDLENLLGDIKKENNPFLFWLCKLNEVKTQYEFLVFQKNISVELENPELEKKELDIEPWTIYFLEILNNCESYFAKVEHINNLVGTLATKYEVLHFAEKYDEAENIKTRMENILNFYEIPEHREKFNYLIEQGTKHETFSAWVETIHSRATQEKEQWEKEIQEMKMMDEEERKYENKSDSHTIELFPIGHFQFPKNKIELFFEILKISDQKIKDQFLFFFSNQIIPRANIFYDRIEEEGYREGNFADKGFQNWKNVYRVRQTFYKNHFTRVEF